MNASWVRHLVQIAPWLTLALLVAMFLFLQNAMAPVPALAFELPDSGAADAAAPVPLTLQVSLETVLFDLSLSQTAAQFTCPVRNRLRLNYIQGRSLAPVVLLDNYLVGFAKTTRLFR